MRLSVERLSAEVLDHIKKWYAKCEEADCMPENGLTIGRLLDTIEALQQENEQLQAQVARMREALIIANHRMPDVGQFCACGKCKTCGADINYAGYEHCVKCARGIIDTALSDTPADYHNPADVEALIMAREAIKAAWSDRSVNAALDKASEALTKIGKALGGDEDAGKK
jgi:hypothetical protein